MKFPKGKSMLTAAVDRGEIPSAAFAVGKGDIVFDELICGSRSVLPQRLPLTRETRFDMASLSKVLATTMVALCALEDGKLSLESKLSDFFDASGEKANITVKQLMTHTAGFEPSLPIWKECNDPSSALEYIFSKPLLYKPGSKEAYSCMGYITLGKVLEKIYETELDKLADKKVFKPLGMNSTGYLPKGENFAATEYISYEDRILCGEVHDENARFLGGVSGNAGVFSTFDDMILFSKMLSKKAFLKKETWDMALTDYTSEYAESRGLGFLLTHSGKDDFSGGAFPDGSYGHTGYTGTSVIVDKETGLFVLLLTNRVHPSRENESLFKLRRELHRTIIAEYNSQVKEVQR